MIIKLAIVGAVGLVIGSAVSTLLLRSSFQCADPRLGIYGGGNGGAFGQPGQDGGTYIDNGGAGGGGTNEVIVMKHTLTNEEVDALCADRGASLGHGKETLQNIKR